MICKMKIIGDAGTGKTRYLKSIMQRWKITGCSHTRTAVERLSTEGAPATKTIHSIALKIALKSEKFRKLYFRTTRAGGVERFRLLFCRQYGIPMHHDPYTPCRGKTFFSIYSHYINTGEIPEDADQKLVRLIPEYEKFKKERKFVDYEDFILAAIDMRESMSSRADIVVDEAQDLSPLQWQFIEAIADIAFLAGDELQSIFSFQGATPERFIQIEGKLKILDYNYRIPGTIWEAAGEVVRRQLRRRRAEPLYEGGIVAEINQTPEAIAKLAAALSRIDRTLLLCRHNSTVLEYSRILDRFNLSYTLVKMDEERGSREGSRTVQSQELLLDTIHTCKGLEAPFVVMVDEPTEKSLEEDRIRYVGMTRASAALIIANQIKNGELQQGYIRQNFDLQIATEKNLRSLVEAARMQNRLISERKKKRAEQRKRNDPAEISEPVA